MSETHPLEDRIQPSQKWSLPGAVDTAISLAVRSSDSQETRRTKRLLTGALWLAILSSFFSVYQFAAIGAPLAALTTVAVALAPAIAILAMWLRPAAFPGVMHLVAGSSLAVSAVLLVMFGGFVESGANGIWGLAAVLGTIVIFEDRRAILWMIAYALCLVVAVFVANQIEPLYQLPSHGSQAVFNVLLVSTFIFGVLYYYVGQRALLLRQSDELLRNILPDEVAERLKTSNETIAREYRAASILFADVAGFTPMSAGMKPVELVTLLDEVFSTFDDLVEQRGLEKIKTIGDAYMVAAGVPTPRDDHAQALCDLALAMQDEVGSRLFQGHQLTFRIGINSGPVVAGIIGRKKFSYDLWGDAVNTASRMEAFGVPGRIQLSRSVYDLVRDDFIFEEAGIVDIKGKGPMPVWHLMEPKSANRANSTDEASASQRATGAGSSAGLRSDP